MKLALLFVGAALVLSAQPQPTTSLLVAAQSSSGCPGTLPALRQSGAVSNTNTLSFGAGPLLNNVIILALNESAGVTVTAITGFGVTTFVKAISSSVNRDVEIWYGTVTTSGITTGTITTSNGSVSNGSLLEATGVATSSPIDNSQAFASNGTSATNATASVTLTNCRDLIIASTRSAAATLSSGPTNSFTELTDGTAGHSAYLIPNALGTYSTGWIQTTSVVYDAVIAAFLP